MTQPTKVHIYTRDAENTDAKLSFNVTPADFGAAVTLPTKAHIETLIGDLFAVPATGTPSTSIVYGYSVEVLNMLDFGSFLGGDGTVASAIAAKTRSGIGETGRVGPMGPEGDEFKIPGLNKAAISYNPSSPSVINMVGAPWVAVRNALLALGYEAPDGLVFTLTTMLESGTVFNGKRAPQRVR